MYHHYQNPQKTELNSAQSEEMLDLICVNPYDVMMGNDSNLSGGSTPPPLTPLTPTSTPGINNLVDHHHNLDDLPMEEFGDLSAFLPNSSKKMALDAAFSTDELNTPVIHEEAFSFHQFTTANNNNNIYDNVNYNIGNFKEEMLLSNDYPTCGNNISSSSSNTVNAPVTSSASNHFTKDISVNNPKKTEQKVHNRRSLECFSPEACQYLQHNHQESGKVIVEDIYCNYLTEESLSPASYEQTVDNSFVPNLKQENQNSPVGLMTPEDSNCSIGSDKVSFVIQDAKTTKMLKLNVNMLPEQGIFGSADLVLSTPDVIDSVVSLEELNLLELLDSKNIPVVSAEDFFTPALGDQNTSTVDFTATQVLPPTTKKIQKYEEISEEESMDKIAQDTDDEDYVPPKALRLTLGRKRSRPSTFDDDSDEEYVVKQSPSKKIQKRTWSVTSSETLDSSSKYRELRDKNNEASKKSRAKRKMKEQQLEEEADELRDKNIKLKARVTELEKMVANFRKDLFTTLIKT